MKSFGLERALRQMGSDIRTARLKRRMSINDMAVRAGIDRKTIMKIEKGEGGVTLSSLGSVLVVLGEERRLGQLLDPGDDAVGLLMDQERLPRRIRSPVRPKQTPSPDTSREDPEEDDIYGVGF